MLTTEHLIQRHDYSPKGEFLNIVLYLVQTYAPQLVMEEWSPDSPWSIARRVADNKKLAKGWHSICPPPTLKLSWHGYRNLDGLMLQEYGAISLQTARERHMLHRVKEAMDGAQTGLLIAGLAHHQSLAEKLTASQYKIESFCWMKPGDPIPDFVSSVWEWESP